MSGALIFAVILLFVVVRMQLGRHPATSASLLKPVVIAAIAGFLYLRHVPTNGSSVLLAAAGAALGIVAGVIAVACIRLERDGNGALYTVCGGAYLAVWVVVLVARITFVYGTQHWWAHAIGTFSAAHQLSSGSWTAFFVLQALAMILVRVARVGIAILGNPAAPVAAGQARAHRVLG